jgi:hypothetical protein
LLVILGVQPQLDGAAAPGVPFKVQYVPGATFQGNPYAVITAYRPFAAAIQNVIDRVGGKVEIWAIPAAAAQVDQILSQPDKHVFRWIHECGGVKARSYGSAAEDLKLDSGCSIPLQDQWSFVQLMGNLQLPSGLPCLMSESETKALCGYIASLGPNVGVKLTLEGLSCSHSAASGTGQSNAPQVS